MKNNVWCRQIPEYVSVHTCIETKLISSLYFVFCTKTLETIYVYVHFDYKLGLIPSHKKKARVIMGATYVLSVLNCRKYDNTKYISTYQNLI